MARKRKLTDESSEAGFDLVSDDEIDISSSLATKKARIDEPAESSDEDLYEFLHESIAKKNVKSGTELLKKVKGKTKLAKGEVGGGSFQSMGLHLTEGLNMSIDI